MLGVCDYIKNTIFNKLTNGDKSNVPKGETFDWRLLFLFMLVSILFLLNLMIVVVAVVVFYLLAR